MYQKLRKILNDSPVTYDSIYQEAITTLTSYSRAKPGFFMTDEEKSILKTQQASVIVILGALDRDHPDLAALITAINHLIAETSPQGLQKIIDSIGSRLEEVDQEGNHVLFRAIHSRSDTAAPLLAAIRTFPAGQGSILARENNKRLSSLSRAIVTRQPTLVRSLLQAIATLSLEEQYAMLTHSSQSGNTVLMLAITYCPAILPEFFAALSQCSTPDQQYSLCIQTDVHGHTPLMIAANYNRHDAIQQLSRTASAVGQCFNMLMQVNHMGDTALMIATSKCHLNSVQALLNSEPNPEQRFEMLIHANHYGVTALPSVVFSAVILSRCRDNPRDHNNYRAIIQLLLTTGLANEKRLTFINCFIHCKDRSLSHPRFIEAVLIFIEIFLDAIDKSNLAATEKYDIYARLFVLVNSAGHTIWKLASDYQPSLLPQLDAVIATLPADRQLQARFTTLGASQRRNTVATTLQKHSLTEKEQAFIIQALYDIAGSVNCLINQITVNGSASKITVTITMNENKKGDFINTFLSLLNNGITLTQQNTHDNLCQITVDNLNLAQLRQQLSTLSTSSSTASSPSQPRIEGESMDYEISSPSRANEEDGVSTTLSHKDIAEASSSSFASTTAITAMDDDVNDILEACSNNAIFCPITHEVMLNPVVADDGFTYEEKAIRAWVEKNGTSPMTNEPMSANFKPNQFARSTIAWHKEHSSLLKGKEKVAETTQLHTPPEAAGSSMTASDNRYTYWYAEDTAKRAEAAPDNWDELNKLHSLMFGAE